MKLAEGASNWWGNKPRPHRALIVWAAVATGVMFIGAMTLDATTAGDKTFPSLGAFVWDLTKLAVVATVVFTLIDDIRGWGVAWKRLVVEQTALAAGAQRFAAATWEFVGGKAERIPVSGFLEGAVRDMVTCAAIFNAIDLRRRAFVDANKEKWQQFREAEARAERAGEELPQSPSIDSPIPGVSIQSWDDLVGCLLEGGVSHFDLDRESIAGEPNTAALEAVTENLAKTVRTVVSDPASSIHLLKDATEVLVSLETFPADAATVRAWLRTLAREEAPSLGFPAMPPPCPTAAFGRLHIFLFRVTQEIATGSRSGPRLSG